MNDEQQKEVRKDALGGLLGILLTIGVPVICIPWLLWGPLGILCYVGGLCNSTWALAMSPFLMSLVLVAFVLLPILLARAARTWRRQTRRDIRINLFVLVGVVGFVIPSVLAVIRLGPSPFELFMRGFTRHMQMRADVGAMQQWLRSLDPNDYRDESAGVWERPLAESEQPPAIARLHPKSLILMPDDSGRPMVCLLWGSGMLGHWGIQVGFADMEVSEDSHDLYHKPLAPGAYTWGGY